MFPQFDKDNCLVAEVPAEMAHSRMSICSVLIFYVCPLFLLPLPNIYNSIYNLHSLLILCFLKAVFTKAIYILNTTSLHRVLVRAWFSLASFGVWCSDTQAHPANALAHILSPVTSTGMPPIQKFLGGVKVVSSKSDFLLPPCEMLLWEPICHMERNHHLHTQKPVHIHAHHAEVGEKANYPLCEWVCVCAVKHTHLVWFFPPLFV